MTEQTVQHLQEQLDLANSRMQSANHAFQNKTNEMLELHAQFIMLQKRYGELLAQSKEHQKLVDEMQKKICELTDKCVDANDAA